MTARINAQNYLRVAGRQLGLDVRTFAGGYSAPTRISPYLTKMELAAYAADSAGFHQEYVNAVEAAREAGYSDPVGHIKDAFASRNPLRSVFRTSPSEADYGRILAELPDSGQTDVREAVNLFNRAASKIGIKVFEGKQEKEKPVKLPLPRFSLSDFRSAAVERMFAR